MKETVAFMLEPEHRAAIDEFAKAQGYPSASSALRRIIDEWRAMRRERARLAADACCEEEVRATRALHGLETRAEALARTDADRRAWERCGDPDEVEG